MLGQRAVRSRAVGYAGPLCSICDSGYVLQFGACVQCQSDAAATWGFATLASILLVLVAALAVSFNDLLPNAVLKIALALTQISANAATSFYAPWPDAFQELARGTLLRSCEPVAPRPWIFGRPTT